MAEVWRVSVRFVSERVRRGDVVSGAEMVMISGFEGFGVMVMGRVVAALSSKVGCIRQYLSLASSQRSILASRSWARLTASACRETDSLRESLWDTATVEDWSRAMRPANLGKIEVMRGEVDVGFERLELLIWMVGFWLVGCVRETAMASLEADRV